MLRGAMRVPLKSEKLVNRGEVFRVARALAGSDARKQYYAER